MMDKKIEEEYQEKIKEKPQSGQAHAEKIFEKDIPDTLNHDSTNANIHLQDAKFCLEQKRTQEGYHHMEKVMELEPNNGKMMVKLAGLWMIDDFQYVKTENFIPDPVKVAKYDDLYQKAFNLAPNEGDLHLTYGFYMFWIKQERRTELRESISHFERAIELEPDSIGFKLDFAGILEIKGDPKYDSQIEQIYHDLMEQHPSQNDILYMYSGYLQNTKRNPQAAEKIILRMIENEPQNGAVYSRYSDFLMKTSQDFKTAERNIKKAIELTPKHEEDELNSNKVHHAGILFLSGNIGEGLQILSSISQNRKGTLYQLVIPFLRYLYTKKNWERKIQLDILKTNIEKGNIIDDMGSDYWMLENHVQNAIKYGHTHPDKANIIKIAILGQKK